MALTWTDKQIGTSLLPVPFHIRDVHVNEIRNYLDNHIGSTNSSQHPLASESAPGFMSSAQFIAVRDFTQSWVTVGNGVMTCGGTTPIVSTGGSNPVISINEATTSVKGALSAADKTKLDTAGDIAGRLSALEGGVATKGSGTVTGLTTTTPAVTVGSGATPSINIANATSSNSGLFTAEEKSKLSTMDGFPIGSIIMWHGNSTQFTALFDSNGKGLTGQPFAKWKVLWGNIINGTPFDMRERFPMGADASINTTRASGTNTFALNGAEVIGEQAHTISESEMPIHTHPYNDIFYSEAGGTFPVPGNFGSGRSDNDNLGYGMDRVTGARGGSVAHNNMPPFVRLYFLYKYTETGE
jgi:hypothetical protein